MLDGTYRKVAPTTIHSISIEGRKLLKCFSCARLEYHVTYYSCPKNAKFNPEKLPPHFAENCALYIYGEPQVGAKRIFYSNYFDVEIGESYRAIHLTAKEGYELKIAPESTPQKIIIYALQSKREGISENEV